MKDLSLHILDIMQNSVAAGAHHIALTIGEDHASNIFCMQISDDGRGMDATTLEKVTDPFFTTRTTRKVGLGIPLLKQNAERTGGTFSIRSAVGVGTSVECTFVFDSIDLLPPGDIAGVIALTAASNPGIDIRYSHTTPGGTFVFDTTEIKEILGTVPINSAEVITFMKEMINENIQALATTL